MSITHHNVGQNTDEWYALRVGKITSSNYACIMANATGGFGEPAKKYALKVALERVTGLRCPESFSNAHTARGHEQEPDARLLYEFYQSCKVVRAGFFCDEIYGGSPDGLVGDDGLIEIKSVIPSIHYDNLRRDKWCPTKHWQMVGNLEITGRKFIDFVSYCPEFPEHKHLVVRRMMAGQVADDIVKLQERRQNFNDLVEKIRGEIQ